MKIASIRAREILDSRGNPTVEADVLLEGGSMGRAAVPSGASTGSHEAHELRDGDARRYGGKGVLTAVANVAAIEKAVQGQELDQAALDHAMLELDGTPNKERLGANAILAVSLSFARAAAAAQGVALYEYIASLSRSRRPYSLPLPMCNIVNGGKHAAGSTDIQEFMVAPIGAASFREGIRMAAEIFHALKGVIADKGYATTVGDEGGYAPHVKGGNREALELISAAVGAAGYSLGKDVVLALDVAASELADGAGYRLATEGKSLSSADMIAWYERLAAEFPIRSIEDGLGENDWEGWKQLTQRLGALQLVGDDLLVTNVEFLRRAIAEKAGNAMLVKPNQIGTLTQTVQAVDEAHAAGWKTVVSHRSGETEDTFIAHLAVGLGTGQIKTGSLSRSERVGKYNELLRIEEVLGSSATFVGGAPLA